MTFRDRGWRLQGCSKDHAVDVYKIWDGERLLGHRFDTAGIIGQLTP
jgi:hypothetical protein